MARRPAPGSAARRRAGADAGAGEKRGLSPLVLASLGVLGVFGALVIWLAVSAEPNRAPVAVVTLPADSSATPQAPEPLPLAPAAPPPAAEHGTPAHEGGTAPAAAHGTPEAAAPDAHTPDAPAADAHGAPADPHAPPADAHGATEEHAAPAGEDHAAAGDPAAADAHGAPEGHAAPDEHAAPDAHGAAAEHGAAPTGLPAAPEQMVAAPDPALVQDGPDGLLPIVAADGRAPWHTYARPYKEVPGKPRIAIVVAGLGLKQSTTNQAVRTLPPEVTLAYSPYARGLTDGVAAARTAGHEVLIQVPMEPADYPTNDPGPQTLLVRNPPDVNRQRLEWSLARAVGYVGIVPMMGSRILGDETAMKPIVGVLKQRGLLLLDSRATPTSAAAGIAAEESVPRAIVDTVIDLRTSRNAIDARLAELERQAQATGQAIGLASDYPVSLERIAVWAADLERRGIVLVPVTALANRQKID